MYLVEHQTSESRSITQLLTVVKDTSRNSQKELFSLSEGLSSLTRLYLLQIIVFQSLAKFLEKSTFLIIIFQASNFCSVNQLTASQVLFVFLSNHGFCVVYITVNWIFYLCLINCVFQGIFIIFTISHFLSGVQKVDNYSKKNCSQDGQYYS